MNVTHRPHRAVARRAAALGVLAALAGSTALAAPSSAALNQVTSAAATGTGPGVLRSADDAVTWSVKPAPIKNKPQRAGYSYDLKKGQTIRDVFQVRNYNRDPLDLTVYATDGFNSPDGTVDLLKPDEKPTDVGSWVTLEKSSLRIPPLSSVDVPFTVRVPQDAEPGDHLGGVVTSFVSPSTGQGGTPVKLDRRLGAGMVIRVDGPLNPQLTITNLKTTYDGTLNPAGKGETTTTYTVTNSGNVRMAADQALKISSPIGFPSRQLRLDPLAELYPGNSLTLTQRVPEVWPTVRTGAKVTLVPKPTRQGDSFGTDLRTSATTGTWSIPWTLLGLMLLVGVVIAVRSRLRQSQGLPIAAPVPSTPQAAL